MTKDEIRDTSYGRWLPIPSYRASVSWLDPLEHVLGRWNMLSFDWRLKQLVSMEAFPFKTNVSFRAYRYRRGIYFGLHDKPMAWLECLGL